MFSLRTTGLASCFILLLFAIGQAQTSPTDLRIEGPAGQSIRITTAKFSKLPHMEYRAKDHDGQEHTYAGVSLATLLQQAGAPLGGQLRGKALANYLLVSATDGYKVVFALPELDSLFAKQVIFLAGQRDGKALPSEQGPYRVVVPQETKQARWVRQVTSLRIQAAKE